MPSSERPCRSDGLHKISALVNAVDPETNEFLHVRLFPTWNEGVPSSCLSELSENHGVVDVAFLVDPGAWLKAALHRHGLRFRHKTHGNRNTAERLLQEIKRRTYQLLLDMGAGVGRHSLYFQDQFETVAIEQNEMLVEVLRDRGVTDARRVNMFTLSDAFEANTFRSAIAFGTQVGLSRSMQGFRQFLDNLAYVTTPDATAVIDGFDPENEKTKEKLDYYDDPSKGLAYRLLQMEYDGILGEPWLYRLFTPDRIREATTDTEWEVCKVKYGPEYIYQLALRKQ